MTKRPREEERSGFQEGGSYGAGYDLQTEHGEWGTTVTVKNSMSETY